MCRKQVRLFLYDNKCFITPFLLTHTLNDLFDLQDDLGGQSHKSKIFLELLVEKFVNYTLFSWKGRNTYF